MNGSPWISEKAVEAVVRHRIKRAEEQPGVGEGGVGPRLRELLRAEVEDWLPALLSTGELALREKVEQELELDQLRSELQRIAEGRMTLDSTEVLTWAEGWLVSLSIRKDGNAS